MRISIPQALVKDPAQIARTHEQILRRIEAVPGIQSVGLSSSVTMDGVSSSDPIFVEDFPVADGQLPPMRRFKFVSERFFETMGNPVIAGRAITWSDIHNTAPVVMVSENFAREFWGDPARAVGRRIRQNPNNPWREIVGVVGSERQDGVTQAPPTIIYWPLLVKDWWTIPVFVQSSLVYAMRTPRLHDAGFFREVQEAVWSVNPNLPLARVRTLQEIYDDSMAQTSFTLVILGIAAAVTLLLGVVGIYGVIAYVVSQRRREIGIRLALGARGGDVQRMFVTRGMMVTGIGLVAGLAGALATMRLLAVVLFGVSPFDPITYAVVLGGLGLVALGATWLPARQATAVDPALTLRGE
jgi:predicted permease